MKQTAMHAAVAGALMVGMTSMAHANFYGVSSLEITDFGISGDANIGFVGAGPFTTSLDRASWDDNDESNSDSLDAEVADCGPGGCNIGLGENNFVPRFNSSPDFPPTESDTVGLDYAKGDAAIFDDNILGGTGAASNIAEVVSAPGTYVELATGEGDNSFEAVFNTDADGGSLTFDFIADVFLGAWTGDEPGGKGFSEVGADVDFNITITSNGTLVFDWTPDTSGSPFCDGTLASNCSASEAFSLNTGVFCQTGCNPDLHDPTGDGIGGNTGAFTATIGTLLPAPSGEDYRLSITMVEAARGSQIPVPATLALLGVGLLGIGAIRRRKAAA